MANSQEPWPTTNYKWQQQELPPKSLGTTSWQKLFTTPRQQLSLEMPLILCFERILPCLDFGFWPGSYHNCMRVCQWRMRVLLTKNLQFLCVFNIFAHILLGCSS